MKIFLSGNLVRDIGMVYFYKVFKSSINIKLSRNYMKLELDENIENFISEYILNVSLFNTKFRHNNNLKGVIQEEFNDIDSIRNYPQKIADNFKGEDILNQFNNTYFPFERNSGKYGANSGTKDNAISNFKKLVHITFSMLNKNGEVLKDYETIEDDYCSVCHQYNNTRFDITNKTNKTDKTERIISKNNFTFMGIKNSTFNNYGQNNNNVCFVCEFFNLMFLLYISNEHPATIPYVDNLKDLYYFIFDLNSANENDLIEKYLAKSNNIRFYNIETDMKKGVMLTFEYSISKKNIYKILQMLNIIDQFSLSLEEKKQLKKFIFNENFLACKEFLINKLKDENMYKMHEKITLFSEFILLDDNSLNNPNLSQDVFNAGKKLSSYFENDPIRKSTFLKIIEILRTGDNETLFETIASLLLYRSIAFPKGFSNAIFNSESENEKNYFTIRFLQGFIYNSN